MRLIRAAEKHFEAISVGVGQQFVVLQPSDNNARSDPYPIVA